MSTLGGVWVPRGHAKAAPLPALYRLQRHNGPEGSVRFTRPGFGPERRRPATSPIRECPSRQSSGNCRKVLNLVRRPADDEQMSEITGAKVTARVAWLFG